MAECPVAKPMSISPPNRHTITLDRICNLAETSAGVYATLSEMAVDGEVAARLSACARARSQAANDLLVARQESGMLPARSQPEGAALQSDAMKLDSLVENTEAMYRSLRDMDLDLRDLAQDALRKEDHPPVNEALQSLLLSLEEAARAFEAD